MQFDILLYQSEELANHNYNKTGDSDIAGANAVEYLNKAFDKSWNSHDVNPVHKSTDVNAPVETNDTSFTAEPPCTSVGEGEFSNLLEWWELWVDCYVTSDPDCAILMTDAEGGGATVGDYYSVACHAKHLWSLPTGQYYSDHGDADGFNSMQNVFHEIAHALLGSSYDTDEEHNMGNVDKIDGVLYRTPIGHGGSTGQNYCGDQVEWHTTDGEAMYYDDCTASHMEHTG